MREFSYSEYYSDEADIYKPPVGDGFQKGVDKARSYVDFVSRYFEKPGNLLDVGCNAGQLLLAFKQDGWNVKGLDLNPSVVKHARDLGLDATVAPLDECDFEQESFDMVTMSHTLEHIPELDKTIKECHRILKPSGCLFIAVPNFGCRLEVLLLRGRWSGFIPAQHIWYFTKETLGRTITRCGFATVMLRSMVDHPTNHGSLARRTIRRCVVLAERTLNDGNELIGLFRKA